MSSVSKRRMAGFTLVEMMVAMTLSLILLGGVVSVLYSSKLTYNENERVARLQENMRAGVEIIARDLRGGGFPGCSRPLKTDDFQNVLTNPTTFYWNFARPVEGFDATASGWNPALPVPLDTLGISLGNDVLVMRTVRSNSRTYRLNTTMASATANIVIKKGATENLSGLVRTPMIVSDCQYATVFTPTAITDGGATATLAHVTTGGSGTQPRNASTTLGIYRAAGKNSMATVAPVDTIAYFIAPSTPVDGVSRGPSLWRISATQPTNAPREAQEVIEGVEAMQVRFGVDTNGDMFVDDYRKADTVTDWTAVKSVSLAVVVRSMDEINPEVQDAQVFDLLGESYTSPSDRRSRALFTTTIALRNRTI